MVVVSAAFRSWLKASTNMKLSSDASVTRVTHEGITDFRSLIDFDKETIQNLPKVCKQGIDAIAADPANNVVAEAEIPAANVSSISVQRLIVARNAARYYDSIGRTMTVGNMHYANILSNFKVEYDAYEVMRNEDDPSVPKINDRDNDRKIIRWAPIFLDSMEHHYGAKGPLRYVLRENATVLTELEDPLTEHVVANPAAGTDAVQGTYYGESGSLVEELIARLPHEGPIFRNDNATVFQKIEEAARGTSCESTIKAFARRKDGRGAFYALISNHAGDVKYRAIAKKRQNLLQNIKWTGNSYPLETHVSNHRQAFDDLVECSEHIITNVPEEPQRVEFLIDSITSKDSTLQATIGLIRANTNNMRNDFEGAASSLIEVDPYRRTTRNPNRSANVSAIDFSVGRGKTGVDLRFHPKDKYMELPKDQQDELSDWLSTKEGKKSKREYFASRRKNSGNKTGDSDGKENYGKRKADTKANNWKKKFKRALKSERGLKTVMSVLADEEKENQALVSMLKASLTSSPVKQGSAKPPSNPPASVSSISSSLPATSIKLASILRNNNK